MSHGKMHGSGSVAPWDEGKETRMVLFRRLLGDVLRAQRMRRGMTLREVSADARVSLGYISEIERGQKEASSELLASLCSALDLPLSVMLREVSDLVALEESLTSTPSGNEVVASAA
jgi:transcriptional regulator with XRE-family HTH domain